MNTQRWNRIMVSAIMGLCLCSTVEALEVNDKNDSNTPDDGKCSLREAITLVNDPLLVIFLPECTPVLPPVFTTINFIPDLPTITLLSALPALARTVDIVGPVAASQAVSGNSMFRVFNITSGTVTISNLTIQNGRSSDGAGLRIASGSTGNITDSTISNNTGDGIFSEGTLSLARSTVSGNGIGGAGAGIRVRRGITDIVNSTISSNVNTGILVDATATSLTMFYSTVTKNGGTGLSNGRMAMVNSTIFSEHAANGNCTGAVDMSSDYNLDDTDTNTCGFDPTLHNLLDTKPLLDGLENNGGPTLTHALKGGIGASPAINNGDPDKCGTTFIVDQRGEVRPSGSACDIGAFERQPGDTGSGSGGGGLCSLAGEGAAFDPTLWLLVLVSCIYLGYRRTSPHQAG